MPSNDNSYEPKRRIRPVGQFVAVWRASISGPWQTYEDALRHGYEEFGVAPFLVRQVEAIEAEMATKLRAAA